MAINISKSISKMFKRQFSPFSQVLCFIFSSIHIEETRTIFFLLIICCWCNAEDREKSGGNTLLYFKQKTTTTTTTPTTENVTF